MAITQTGAMYKSLTFDGKTSREYGVYITGQAVYNAPERDVEMITIPGRNGSFALDNGRFQNITVTYPAGIFAENEADFAQAVSDFRNYLCSRKGYCRLTDEYNPSEYRMAVYKSGLDVDPAQLRAGEFEITFECKPQRWLTSGETATAVANNGTLTNPTLFDSQPLLAIKGYGTIGFNGYEIELDNAVLGHVLFKNGQSNVNISGSTYAITFTEHVLNAGDTITMGASDIWWRFETERYLGAYLKADVTSNSGISGSVATIHLPRAGYEVPTSISLPALTFTKGTASSYTNTTVISGWDYDLPNSYTAQLVLTVSYNGYGSITFTFADTYTYSVRVLSRCDMILTYDDITGESTQSQLGNPTYIDCEIGDAYKIVSDEYVSLNSNVDLGSDLPKLASGSNTVTFDNTVTELKITPRWWKV